MSEMFRQRWPNSIEERYPVEEHVMTCPTCGAGRIGERTRCLACGAEFPPDPAPPLTDAPPSDSDDSEETPHDNTHELDPRTDPPSVPQPIEMISPPPEPAAAHEEYTPTTADPPQSQTHLPPPQDLLVFAEPVVPAVPPGTTPHDPAGAEQDVAKNSLPPAPDPTQGIPTDHGIIPPPPPPPSQEWKVDEEVREGGYIYRSPALEELHDPLVGMDQPSFSVHELTPDRVRDPNAPVEILETHKAPRNKRWHTVVPIVIVVLIVLVGVAYVVHR